MERQGGSLATSF